MSIDPTIWFNDTLGLVFLVLAIRAAKHGKGNLITTALATGLFNTAASGGSENWVRTYALLPVFYLPVCHVINMSKHGWDLSGSR